MLLAQIADQPGQRIVEHGHVPLELVGDPLELLALGSLGGEHPRQRVLLVAQYVHGEAAGPADDGQRARRVVEAHEHEQGIQRERAQRVDRQAAGAVGTACRHHRDPGGEMRDHPAIVALVGADGHGAVLCLSFRGRGGGGSEPTGSQVSGRGGAGGGALAGGWARSRRRSGSPAGRRGSGTGAGRGCRQAERPRSARPSSRPAPVPVARFGVDGLHPPGAARYGRTISVPVIPRSAWLATVEAST